MKTDKMIFTVAGSYESPVVTVLTLCHEGLLCMSFEMENEDFEDEIPLF